VNEPKLNLNGSRRSKLDSILAGAKQQSARELAPSERLRPNQLNDHEHQQHDNEQANHNS
jgi:hypothetical protein